jgi:hypothetical protein
MLRQRVNAVNDFAIRQAAPGTAYTNRFLPLRAQLPPIEASIRGKAFLCCRFLPSSALMRGSMALTMPPALGAPFAEVAATGARLPVAFKGQQVGRPTATRI